MKIARGVSEKTPFGKIDKAIYTRGGERPSRCSHPRVYHFISGAATTHAKEQSCRGETESCGLLIPLHLYLFWCLLLWGVKGYISEVIPWGVLTELFFIFIFTTILSHIPIYLALYGIK